MFFVELALSSFSLLSLTARARLRLLVALEPQLRCQSEPSLIMRRFLAMNLDVSEAMLDPM